MKLYIFAACALITSPLFAAESQNLIRNGDFEAGKDTRFYATPPWYNRGAGLNQGANARSDRNVITRGQYSAVVNDRYDSTKPAFGGLAHSQNTDYIIQEGDVFFLSYDLHPVDSYWQAKRDSVRFVLYATSDNKLGGPMVWSSVLTSDFFSGSISIPKAVVQQTESINPAAVGRKLFLVFHGLDTVDGTAGSTHYARVDNIAVTAGKAAAKAPN
jgi:hypothetical protein